MGRLLLVRHGESVWNRDKIVQGQAGPGLTDRGHDQAAHLGRWLADEVDGDVAFVSSDLVRCRETAAPFAALLDRDPSTDEALRERHFGDWQGVARAELEERDPKLWQRFRAREDVVGEAGGESTPQLNDRVVPRLRALAAAASVTVVVTHGGPVWHGTHALLGVEEGVLGPVSNAGVTVLDVEEAWTGLLAWNQVGHLPPALRTTWPAPKVPVS
jgi:probable phosphoglycerate mutase